MKFSLSQLTKGYIITPPKFFGDPSRESYVVGLTILVASEVVVGDGDHVHVNVLSMLARIGLEVMKRFE